MQIGRYYESGENLKNRMKSIAIGTLASLLMIVLMAMIVTPVHAEPSDAMWIEPNAITLDSSSIGTTFNITVWLNITENIYAYEFGLHYNITLLNCTRAAFTSGITSNYFAGHTTVPAGPLLNPPSLGNGSVFAGESCLSSDFVVGPKNASLCWIEFNVLNFTAFLPPSGNLTTKFDITTEYPTNTYVLDTDLNNINIITTDSIVTIIPEFPYLVILPIFMALTLAGAVLSRRQKKLK
jgi:hypothetical protein